MVHLHTVLLFFFNDTATTEIYTLSLHDALPISRSSTTCWRGSCSMPSPGIGPCARSEEHTSELQSHHDLVCRLLLEKKKPHETSVSPLYGFFLSPPLWQLRTHALRTPECN